MKKSIFLMILLSSLLAKTNAQTLKDSVALMYSSYADYLNAKDSVKIMYTNYFELLQTKEKVDSLKEKISGLENRYVEFNEALESNNELLVEITHDELYTLQRRLDTRRSKIINTADFIETANVSLNTIKLIDAVTAYLSSIASLNSPDNTELGFSLNNEIEKILNQNIIKGTKINGGSANKFLKVVDNIIKSPVTDFLSSAVPVISSIKSVVNLVVGTATRGKDITIDDITAFKKSLKDYLQHYEGLALAQSDFNQKLNSVEVRKEALILLLRQFTTERTLTLLPTISKNQLANLTITEITTRHFSKEDVQMEVDLIISRNPANIDLLLSDSKLVYPEYGLSQAKFIRDEIDALGKEYLAAYESYQIAIVKVLGKSKNIGKADLIDNKISTLKTMLEQVEKSFMESLNIENLNIKFEALPTY